jgi:hypothetical protein
MAQITIRADEPLADAVRKQAADDGKSMNEAMLMLMRVYVDPDLAGTDAERIRARLKRAGLLASPIPTQAVAPDPAKLARARAAAGAGTPLSAHVHADRD